MVSTASCVSADWLLDEHDGLHKVNGGRKVANEHSHDQETAAVSAVLVQP